MHAHCIVPIFAMHIGYTNPKVNTWVVTLKQELHQFFSSIMPITHGFSQRLRINNPPIHVRRKGRVLCACACWYIKACDPVQTRQGPWSADRPVSDEKELL